MEFVMFILGAVMATLAWLLLGTVTFIKKKVKENKWEL